MNTVPKNTDPLDAAYLAIGAARALDDAGARRYEAVTGSEQGLGGELDVIAFAISAAPILQRLWEEVADDWGGVWAYDVAEPLGARCVTESLSTDEELEEHARDLIRMAQELTG